jgi:hypothetical protein
VSQRSATAVSFERLMNDIASPLGQHRDAGPKSPMGAMEFSGRGMLGAPLD